MYTDTIQYMTPPAFPSRQQALRRRAEKRIIVDGDNPIYSRAAKVFDPRLYMYPSPPVFLGQRDIVAPDEPVYILRMAIATPTSGGMILPMELEWVSDFVQSCLDYQASAFPEPNRFCYLTVRHGPVCSNHDDTFHVDGFQGVLQTRHLPEQSSLWVDQDPTLFAVQPFFIEDLDAAKHNVHKFFDKNVCRANLYSGVEKGIYCFDPYHIHARPKTAADLGCRTMVRLSCLTVEVRDDTNTANPFLRMGPYNKPDPRNNLWDFPIANPEIKFGLRRA